LIWRVKNRPKRVILLCSFRVRAYIYLIYYTSRVYGYKITPRIKYNLICPLKRCWHGMNLFTELGPHRVCLTFDSYRDHRLCHASDQDSFSISRLIHNMQYDDKAKRSKKYLFDAYKNNMSSSMLYKYLYFFYLIRVSTRYNEISYYTEWSPMGHAITITDVP